MRRCVAVGFEVVFAAALVSGAGCALTNYEMIVDSDGRPINTAGNAYVRQEQQFATTYPDGTDNLLWYVDQKPNGDRKLSTVNYFTPPSGTNYFKDDQYCLPDFSGCKIATADDPEVGDVDPFDVREFPSCSGYRSLLFLIQATREFGECGRSTQISNALRMAGLASSLRVDRQGWVRKELSAQNTSVVLDNRQGDVYRVPLTTTVGVRANLLKGQISLDLTNPKTRDDFQNAIAWSKAHPSPNGFVATVTVDGVDLTYRVKFARNAANGIDRRYR